MGRRVTKGIMMLLVTFTWLHHGAAQAPPRPRPGGAVGGSLQPFPVNPLQLLIMPDVQRELRLSPTQANDVGRLMVELSERSGQPARPGLRAPNEVPRMAERMQQLSRAELEYVTKHLDRSLAKSQKQRLRELSLQFQGIEALNQEEVAQELQLTGKQRAQIGQLSVENWYLERQRLTNALLHGGNSGALQAELLATSQEAERRLQGVLSPEQRQKYQALLGKPFWGFVNVPRR